MYIIRGGFTIANGARRESSRTHLRCTKSREKPSSSAWPVFYPTLAHPSLRRFSLGISTTRQLMVLACYFPRRVLKSCWTYWSPCKSAMALLYVSPSSSRCPLEATDNHRSSRSLAPSIGDSNGPNSVAPMAIDATPTGSWPPQSPGLQSSCRSSTRSLPNSYRSQCSTSPTPEPWSRAGLPTGTRHTVSS